MLLLVKLVVGISGILWYFIALNLKLEAAATHTGGCPTRNPNVNASSPIDDFLVFLNILRRVPLT
jgi:hypothetical protein